MPIKYQKYDIATKVSLVEEYLELSKTSKITKTDFAHEKGISDSTFNDWVISIKSIRIDLLVVLIIMVMIYLLFLILNHHLLS